VIVPSLGLQRLKEALHSGSFEVVSPRTWA
jgi:hypothetical protein